MNSTSNSGYPQGLVPVAISERAAQFVARIHAGDLSAADEEELFAWLDQDELHREEYQRMLDVHDRALGVAEGAETGSPASNESPVARGASTRRPGVAWSLAAGVAVAVAAGLLLGPFSSSQPAVERNAFSTAIGEQRLIVLDEGSEIYLNTNTQISIELTDAARHVELQQGEAFFTVSPDKARPFSVSAVDGAATALGTEFNVMLTAAGLNVSVSEGTVALHSMTVPASEVVAQWRSDEAGADNGEGQVVILENGSSATISGQTISVLQEQDRYRFGEWRSGVLRFENRTLSSLMQELNRYTPDTIEFDTPEVAARTVSGVLDLRDFDSVWLGLEATANVQVVRQPGRVILTAKDEQRAPEAGLN